MTTRAHTPTHFRPDGWLTNQSCINIIRARLFSANDQPGNLANLNLPSAFAQYARPLQTSPQDIYYLTARSFPSLLSNMNTAGLLHGAQQLLERVARAIDNADKRYN